MGISGSLKFFSLPEILQIIDTGSKSGRLSINSSVSKKESQKLISNTLWFQKGEFIAISSAFGITNNLLFNLIRKNNFLSSKEMVDLYKIQRKLDISLGEYCLNNALLDDRQIDRLFAQQVKIVCSLFKLESGYFIFEDLDSNNCVGKRQDSLPFLDMTGRKANSLAISLKGMRSLKKLDSRLTEQKPEVGSGFIRLLDNYSMDLLPIESCIVDDANGNNSLKKIAKKTLFDIEELKDAALRLILIGLIEEVPIAGYSNLNYTPPVLEKELVLAKVQSTTKKRKPVSDSLLGNLVSFLRNNF